MNRSTIKLMQLVGYHLAGKALYIRERPPATKNTAGEIHRDAEGQLIIDISPEIRTDEKRLTVYLHEIGHAKAHNFLRSNQNKAAPKSQALDPLTRAQYHQEDTADKWAAKWQAWGSKHANPEIYKIAPLEAVLIALLDYPEEGKK